MDDVNGFLTLYCVSHQTNFLKDQNLLLKKVDEFLDISYGNSKVPFLNNAGFKTIKEEFWDDFRKIKLRTKVKICIVRGLF